MADVLAWLGVVICARVGLLCGLGDFLIRPGVKISADGCCIFLECDGCVVKW